MTLSVNAGVFDDYLADEPAPTPTPAPAAATTADPGEPGEYGYNDLTATTDAMASAANGNYTDAATQRSSVTIAATPPTNISTPPGGGGEDDNGDRSLDFNDDGSWAGIGRGTQDTGDASASEQLGFDI